MLKKDLRHKYLEKRQHLSGTEVNAQSNAICNLLFTSFRLEEYNYLHTFLPIEKKAEVDTFLIIQRIRYEIPKLNIVISQTNVTDCTITNFLFDKDTILEKNKWDILEPIDGSVISSSNIDIILIPLLAFDLAGNRVGYGKGIYDTFLGSCRKDVLKVGLSFFEAEEIVSDAYPGDVKLDYCITPRKVYDFNS